MKPRRAALAALLMAVLMVALKTAPLLAAR